MVWSTETATCTRHTHTHTHTHIYIYIYIYNIYIYIYIYLYIYIYIYRERERERERTEFRPSSRPTILSVFFKFPAGHSFSIGNAQDFTTIDRYNDVWTGGDCTCIYKQTYTQYIHKNIHIHLHTHTYTYTGSFMRFNSRSIMYVAVGSLVSSGVMGPSTWDKFALKPLDLIV